jgi:hypothetical protein
VVYTAGGDVIRPSQAGPVVAEPVGAQAATRGDAPRAASKAEFARWLIEWIGASAGP